MSRLVNIGNKIVGEGQPSFIIAEIGINHNGDLEIAKKLIDATIKSGADAVKFQKRTVEVVYTKEDLDRPRESPFGSTNRELKETLEFGFEEYSEIDKYCRARDMIWFASCWDEGSVDFIEQFNLPCYKIASACLTDNNLLRYHKKLGKPIILSTGMSTMEQIRHAVGILGQDNLILMHCTGTYPSKNEELNLRVILTLKEEFDCPIGYSGHEVGLPTTVAAVALRSTCIERHITLDRAMWGSDQAASVEPHGFEILARYIRSVEAAMGDGIKKVYENEKPIIEKLRRFK